MSTVENSRETVHISGEEFDRMFESGEDLDDYLDLDNIRRPAQESHTIVFDLPKYAFDAIVIEAANVGVDFRDLIANWITDKISTSAVITS